MSHKTNENLNIIIKKIAVIIPLAYLLAMYFSNNIHYCESDDGMMNSIARGYFTGKPDEHLIFINSAYGYLTKILYRISSSINWFAMLYIILVIVCSYLIWFIFSKYINYWISLCIVMALESFCVYYFTFTIISFVCSFTGLLLLIDYVTNGGFYRSLKKVLISIAIVTFCCFGFIVRKEAFIVTFFIFIPLLLLNLKMFIKSKKAILIVAIVLVGIASLNIINSLSYSTSLWRNYNKYNVARSKVIDYPIASYKDNQQFYREKNISKNDLYCFKNWIFGDKTVYPEKTLNEIVENTPVKTRYNFNPLKFKIKTYYGFDKYLCYFSLVILLIIAISAMLILKRKRKYLLFQIGVLLFYLVYLFVIKRTVARVILPTIIIVFAIMLYSIVTNRESKQIIKKRFNKKILYSIMVLVMCISFLVFNYLIVERSTRASAKKYENTQIQKYVRTHNNCLFVTGFKGGILYNKPVNKMTDKEIYPNLMQTGDQDIYNNLYYQQLKKLKTKKEYRDRLLMNLLYRENTFMLGNKYQDDLKVQKVRLFLEEHSKRKVECKTVEKIKGTNTYVYQFK